ncbi:PrsW family intramembrane metalloprotease [Paractinoplanes maris]|uniref:PrsW family intramembrane metalloprotease n=1 Tax=Paractinoplanes maris TaxID=1734446 RepID=UPI0020203897|nr:PrsW family glutamic-type intramembrane protease [Actinoplanes maris]
MAHTIHHSASAGAPVRTRPAWAVILVTGLLLWLATVAITFLTANANLVPTLVLLGSFLVPVTFVAWAYEHRDEKTMPVGLLFQLFVVGGILGILGASVLESYLLHPAWWMFAGVGLIEEGVKLAALALLTRHLPVRTVRSGVVLGATVGFGFAAFESAGYALNALLTIDGLSLRSLVETEVLRGLLAPFGHGLWTAILGGLLFRAAGSTGRLRLSWGLVLGYLGVSALHALWDSMHGVAVLLTFLLTSTEGQQRLFQLGWIPQPTDEQVHLFTLLSLGGLVVITVVALLWLRGIWRSGRLAR